MLDQDRKFLSVPPSIELLFNNEKLDMMKVLCLMYAFSTQSRKYRNISEVLFYYGLVNFNLLKVFVTEETDDNDDVVLPNLYFRFQAKINRILINLFNLEFIEIKGDVLTKFDDIKVKLAPKGKVFYEDYNSEFFTSMQTYYKNAFEKVIYSVTNYNKLKEGGN